MNVMYKALLEACTPALLNIIWWLSDLRNLRLERIRSRDVSRYPQCGLASVKSCNHHPMIRNAVSVSPRGTSIRLVSRLFGGKRVPTIVRKDSLVSTAL